LPDKVLVVDDEADILDLARMILEEDGYCVVEASSGDEALLKAEAENPDLILLDVVMPGKSGLEVCKALKSQVRTRCIPMVMFTVLGRDVDKKLAREVGADGHFTKPFTPEDLRAEIRKYLKEIRVCKFSKQLEVKHSKLWGKKILLEFEPSTPYDRLVRDFALECAFHEMKVVVLTQEGSVIQQTLEGDEGIKIVNLATPYAMITEIIEDHLEGPLGLVYDSLTDLALSIDSQAAYKFIRNSLKLLSDSKVTAIFLLNPSAHEPREASSFRGLFSNRINYGKQGIMSVKIT
jgi:CheY-like chemotaxis protein